MAASRSFSDSACSALASSVATRRQRSSGSSSSSRHSSSRSSSLAAPSHARTAAHLKCCRAVHGPRSGAGWLRSSAAAAKANAGSIREHGTKCMLRSLEGDSQRIIKFSPVIIQITSRGHRERKPVVEVGFVVHLDHFRETASGTAVVYHRRFEQRCGPTRFCYSCCTLRVIAMLLWMHMVGRKMWVPLHSDVVNHSTPVVPRGTRYIRILI